MNRPPILIPLTEAIDFLEGLMESHLITDIPVVILSIEDDKIILDGSPQRVNEAIMQAKRNVSKPNGLCRRRK